MKIQSYNEYTCSSSKSRNVVDKRNRRSIPVSDFDHSAVGLHCLPLLPLFCHVLRSFDCVVDSLELLLCIFTLLKVNSHFWCLLTLYLEWCVSRRLLRRVFLVDITNLHPLCTATLQKLGALPNPLRSYRVEIMKDMNLPDDRSTYGIVLRSRYDESTFVWEGRDERE